MAIPVKNILDTLLSQQNNWQLQLLNNWQQIMGTMQTKVQLLKIYEDTLVIGVLDSCWIQELYLLSPLLLKKINEKLDSPRIKHLRFKSAAPPEKKVQKNSLKRACLLKNIQMSPQEKEALASIKDEQLAAVLQDYLLRIYRER
jgi:flagellar biogenesis protein FliO